MHSACFFLMPYELSHWTLLFDLDVGFVSFLSGAFFGFAHSPFTGFDPPTCGQGRVQALDRAQVRRLNSHYFHIIGGGHQPNSRGLYPNYKDSLLKVGWPSPIQQV